MRIIAAVDSKDVGRKTANRIAAQVIVKPDSVLGLATGSSPLTTYAQLIEGCESGDVDYSRVSTINLDEYVGLSGEHDQSYRYFMNHNLFDHINVDKSRTNVPNGLAADSAAECARYDALIAAAGGTDLQLLGIGNNGHIGFNEPDETFTAATHVVELTEGTRQANARFFTSIDAVPTHAITMGMRGIMTSKCIVLIAMGVGKSQALYDSILGPVTPLIPASILQLHPNCTIIADEAALSLIREETGWTGETIEL